jgi:uncharacterized membrane protein YfhO
MRTTALLAEPLPAGIEVADDPQGEVSWVEREADDYTLRVRTDRAALLIISDNYYPAWGAEVDGTRVPLLRANYAFRAVPVPAGEHDVRLSYRTDAPGYVLGALGLRIPVTLRGSATVSIIILILLGAVAMSGLRRSREGAAA